ncbi:hypothetical protein [Micromonospora sp. NPDC004704]
MRRLVPDGPARVDTHGTARARPGLYRMLQGTGWWLHPDGRLLVVPRPGLARDDLFPLPGMHRPEGPGVRFVAARNSPDGSARASMAGGIAPADGAMRLTAEYHIQTPVHDERVTLTQLLRTEEPGAGTGFGRVGGIPLPAVYRVELTGVTDGVAFRSVVAELALLPPTSSELLEVTLFGEDIGVIGDISWLAATADSGHEDIGRYTLDLTGGRLRAELSAPHAGVSTVSWTAPTPVPSGLHLDWVPPPLPVSARRAMMALHFTGTLVTGEVRASGLRDDRVVDYRAEVQGTLVADEPEDPYEAFERAWQSPDLNG